VTAIGAIFRYPLRTSALAGILLAQSAEFSFLLARIGTEGPNPVLSEEHFGLLLTSAALTIVFAPAAYQFGRRGIDRLQNHLAPDDWEEAVPADPEDRRRIAVICGYGRVGRLVAAALQRRGFGFVVVDESPQAIREAREGGMIAIRGNIENRIVLDRAPIERATVLVVAVPDPVTTRFVVDTVRRQHPRLPIVARTHSQSERAVLRQLGATVVVVGEVELALEMTRFTLRQFGVSGPELISLIDGLRRR
jgi:CPA2 family monovalent cation:H+ antiporter-2